MPRLCLTIFICKSKKVRDYIKSHKDEYYYGLSVDKHIFIDGNFVLGGDYSYLPETTFGSKATHSIMSYFEDVDLHIVTFLKGERKVDEPIPKYFKPLEKSVLNNAVLLVQDVLQMYV